MAEEKEAFVDYESIMEPDSRSTVWVKINERTGEQEPITLRDHYERAQSIVIHDSVSEKVYHHLLGAKHLLLYSWYVYRFLPIAYSQALSSVEFALKEKAKLENCDFGSKRGFKALFKVAINEGWIRNEDLKFYPQYYKWTSERHAELRELADAHFGKKHHSKPTTQSPETPDYLAILVDWLPMMRNDLAHGSSYLNTTYNEVEICADVVNALFRPKG